MHLILFSNNQYFILNQSMIKKIFIRSITNRFSFYIQTINHQNYLEISQNFQKSPQLSTLHQYWCPQNISEIFNILKQAHINLPKLFQYYQNLQQLCLQKSTSVESDLQFNILANIYSEKSKILMQENKIVEASLQIERAIQAIQSMENPFYGEVATLSETAANINLQLHLYTKAEKHLQQSQNFMNIAIQEQQQFLDSIPESEISQEKKKESQRNFAMFFAKLYSEFSLLYLKTNQLFNADEYINKSIRNWDRVQDKNIVAYLATIKYLCIVKAKLNKEEQSVEIAQNYLSSYASTPETAFHRLWFLKFLGEKGLTAYKQELKNSISLLSKKVSQKQLQIILMRVGVLPPKKEK